MGKALMVKGGSTTSPSGQFIAAAGGNGVSATEAAAQIKMPAACVLTNLRGVITSGGSGSNSLRLRKNGANANLVATRSGSGAASDTSNSDSIAADDLINFAPTDNGTDPSWAAATMNIEFASGHGCIHAAGSIGGIIYDVGSATRFMRLTGVLTADGGTTEAQHQHKVRGYDLWTHIQVNVIANARVNDSVIRNRINGANGSAVITIPAGQTGIFTATISDALADGDLINYSITLGAGTEDLTLSIIATKLESSFGASELFAQSNGLTRTANASPSTYYLGGVMQLTSSESNARMTPGFPCRLRNLRIYISSNGYTGAATFNLLVNGTIRLTVSISAGATGWLENAVDTYDIGPTDAINVQIDDGTANDLIAMNWAITLGSNQARRSMSLNKIRRAA